MTDAADPTRDLEAPMILGGYDFRIWCDHPEHDWHARGLRQCLSEIDCWAKKAVAIAAETGDGWMVAQVAAILDSVKRLTKNLDREIVKQETKT